MAETQTPQGERTLEETRHTPGPWEVEVGETSDVRYGSAVVRVDVVKGGQRVAGVTIRPGSRALSNARLIAAAPDLLDLVRRLREWDHLDTAGDGEFWKRELDAAIAKATPNPTEAP